MKKTFLTCMAVVALLAIASGAGAITCTIDQRPAATLLIPYFQSSFNLDGTVCAKAPCTAGGGALDTLVTIGNASSAPMLAHVAVWNDRTELVLDFNIALTGFDIQSFSVAQVLRGFLPVTPVNQQHVPEVPDSHQVTLPLVSGGDGDVCQRNPDAPVYPDTGGYLRVKPTNPANPGFDNTSATVAYPAGPFPSSFLFEVLDSLDATLDSRTCLGGVDNTITNPIHGYITIDHANYCTLANPNDALYWTADAAGMENNLFGDYIYTSGAGIPTEGFPAVAIEADPSLADATALSQIAITGVPGRRTFYRRYVHIADNLTNAAGTSLVPEPGCTNLFPFAGATLAQQAASAGGFDCGFGDQREPLGLKYAARWFDTTPVTSFFHVWRGSSGVDAVKTDNTGLNGREDLLGQYDVKTGVAQCNVSEKSILLTFYDEDENTVSIGCTVSPCGTPPTQNFPLETQRTTITKFPHPAWPAGWVSMEFFNSGSPFGGALDQAYVTYSFEGAAAFVNAGMPAAQLDPTNCQPLLVPVQPTVNGVTPTAPVIPLIVGCGPPAAPCGP